MAQHATEYHIMLKLVCCQAKKRHRESWNKRNPWGKSQHPAWSQLYCILGSKTMKEGKSEEHFCNCRAAQDVSSMILLREWSQVQEENLLASQAVLGSGSQKQRWKKNEGGHLASSSDLIYLHSHTYSTDTQTPHTNFHHIQTHRNDHRNSMRTYPMCV